MIFIYREVILEDNKEKSSVADAEFSKQLFKTYLALDNWHRFRLRLFIEGILVGIAGGLAVGVFRFLLTKAEFLRLYGYENIIWPAIKNVSLLPLFLWLCSLVFIAAALYKMCRVAPMASGSGIPQVKGVILGLFKMDWLRILWVKIVAGAAGIGAGLSLGREGPSIQIGAVAAQGLSRFMGRTRMEERYLITAGAGAGLAAAFNAPVAGMMFALEELHRNFSGAVLLPTMAAAVSATIVSRLFFGSSTSFLFPSLVRLPSEYLVYVIFIAVTCGIGGIIFNYGLLHTDKFYGLPVFKNQSVKILFALLTAAVLGLCLPQVLGGGNTLVDTLAETRYSLGFICLLLLGKYLFTLISYGCGVPGGFFLPLLVTGALMGSAEACIFVSSGFLADMYTPNIIIISMAAFFAASVRAPITGTLLILEMTGDFDHLMALSLSSAVAYITAEFLKGSPIYDALLKKSLAAGNTPVLKEERNIMEVPVGSGSILENRTVEEIPRLPHTVLVNIKRQGESMIPDPDIRLRQGDFLYFLTESGNSEKILRLGAEQVPKNHVRKL